MRWSYRVVVVGEQIGHPRALSLFAMPKSAQARDDHVTRHIESSTVSRSRRLGNDTSRECDEALISMNIQLIWLGVKDCPEKRHQPPDRDTEWPPRAANDHST